jgi:hypothetical protein
MGPLLGHDPPDTSPFSQNIDAFRPPGDRLVRCQPKHPHPITSVILQREGHPIVMNEASYLSGKRLIDLVEIE